MKFWTILWITFAGGPYDGEQAFMVYPSVETCEQALTVVSGTLPYDHNLSCQETTVLSASLRPKRRPEGLGQ